ncbi:hypothetical protein MJO28_002896 [Puccinia striiformis f. sp. tritici]|uniref:Uncharacterized protein n=1 Tax=Puccinia striiformis f. sp. tritici TaxID=168172 RepID=A0ACC0EUN2_9BASI|nr:hypothetical protein MJO28_002896 [Puccinia striiformis f. sp. tritici]
MSAVEQFVKIPSPPVGFRTRQNMIKTSAVRLLFGVQSTTAFQQALGDDISMESYNRLVELYHEARKGLEDVDVYVHRNLKKEPSLTDAEREFMVELIRLEPSLFYDKLMEAFFESNGTITMGMIKYKDTLIEKLSLALDIIYSKNGKTLQDKFKYITRIFRLHWLALA